MNGDGDHLVNRFIAGEVGQPISNGVANIQKGNSISRKYNICRIERWFPGSWNRGEGSCGGKIDMPVKNQLIGGGTIIRKSGRVQIKEETPLFEKEIVGGGVYF